MERMNSNGEMLSQIELEKLPYSSFDRSNHNFSSGKLGTIIPTRIDEVYPGDRIVGKPTAVVNFEPLAGPIMGSMVLKQESFYVPLFQVWKNATKFFTGKKGFSQPMPSVTPLRVFNLFFDYLVDPQDWITAISAFLDSPSSSTYDDVISYTKNPLVTKYNLLKTRADSFQMRDLFAPYFERLEHDFIKQDEDSLTAYTLLLNEHLQAPTDATQLALINFVTDFNQYAFDFFFGVSTLADYLGWPVIDNWPDYFELFRRALNPKTPTELPVVNDMFSQIPLNWLPWRAAYLCWYWNYRDELLETECIDPEEDTFLGDNVTNDEIFQLYMLRYRCWYKDTFTTALTNTGDGNLIVPVFDDPDVYGGTAITYYDSNGQLLDTSDYQSAVVAGALVFGVDIGGVTYRVPMNYLQGSQDYYANKFGSGTSGSGTYGFSLDVLDRIKRLRRFTQKKLIVGYEEDDVIWSNFLVRLSNVRMRIPEILSRGRDAIDMQTIINNTNIPNGQIAGDKTAVAWAKGVASNANYFSEQWGFYLSFLTVLPIASYTGGMQRLWMKLHTFDWMWPDFATMGMDAVYNYELSAPRPWSRAGLSDETALGVFGYQGRYYDLKTRQDETHGRLRTDLNYLTFSREFNEDNPPALNYIFVHCHPRTDMFVVDDPAMDLFRFDCYHDLSWRRRLPVPSEIVGY